VRRFLPRAVVAATALAALLSGCIPPSVPPPAPPPAPEAPPPSPPPPPPAPPTADWRDAPISPGDWHYDGNGRSLAWFGPAAGAPSFAARCDGGAVALTLSGATEGPLRITTSFAARTVRAEAQGTSLVATVSPRDRLLDEMAFSCGRFMVEAPGAAPLYVPAWPEFARVVEDCRGGA
jgi:hypothetical protein